MDHGYRQLPVDNDDNSPETKTAGGRGTIPTGGDGDGSADPSSASVRFSPSS
jgi:hypothetical protein